MNRILTAALAGLMSAPLAFAQNTDSDHHIVLTPEAVEWSPGPPKLEQGAQIAVLEGDPAKEEFFTLRLKLPDGFRIQPHTHPTIERVTVISGTFKLGRGEEFDEAKLQGLAAGSYFSLSPETAHFASVEGETVVQISTLGPWDIVYVDPADDPSKKRK